MSELANEIQANRIKQLEDMVVELELENTLLMARNANLLNELDKLMNELSQPRSPYDGSRH